jgi:DNA-binding beta-propeller fold protein YncE
MNVLKEQHYNTAAAFPDASGRILLSDISTNKLLVVDRAGDTIACVSSGNFNHPEGMAFDRETGEVYVADRYNNCVKVFDYTFNLKRTLDGLQQPIGLAFDSIRRVLYVADSQNNRVQMLSRNGDVIDTIEGDGDERLCGPSGVALYGDFLIITEPASGRLQIWKDDSPVLVAYGFPLAHHVAVDPN